MDHRDFCCDVLAGRSADPAKADSPIIAAYLDRLAVPVAEACRISGLSRSELYRRMASGQIEARKSGRTTLVLMASLRAHLDSLPPATFRPARALPNDPPPALTPVSLAAAVARLSQDEAARRLAIMLGIPGGEGQV